MLSLLLLILLIYLIVSIIPSGPLPNTGLPSILWIIVVILLIFLLADTSGWWHWGPWHGRP